jgi:hypothetical protein
MRDRNPCLLKAKRACTTMFLEKYGFNLYKGFLMEKNDPNLPDFERVFYQIGSFYYLIPVGSQECRSILFIFYFHI